MGAFMSCTTSDLRWSAGKLRLWVLTVVLLLVVVLLSLEKVGRRMAGEGRPFFVLGALRAADW